MDSVWGQVSAFGYYPGWFKARNMPVAEIQEVVADVTEQARIDRHGV